ncbi:hypothetical protein N658DRAFT_171751 [Parathielavia hyrcaniae]|uniref:Uncharacterized protein n=1 Tax=Parathielavia hyrcaniae TaxID=113614 RepID=A0AAN6PWG4_9PEZI|nr:hypothetical protein N658DRAFT_171751 [Parathielavia hyrcaniae]
MALWASRYGMPVVGYGSAKEDSILAWLSRSAMSAATAETVPTRMPFSKSRCCSMCGAVMPAPSADCCPAQPAPELGSGFSAVHLFRCSSSPPVVACKDISFPTLMIEAGSTHLVAAQNPSRHNSGVASSGESQSGTQEGNELCFGSPRWLRKESSGFSTVRGDGHLSHQSDSSRACRNPRLADMGYLPAS